MRRGFTLVEMMVVMMILVVLAGLILIVIPGGRSHTSSRRKNCASNLRQFGLAAATYSGDYNEQMPTVLSYPDGIAMAGDGLASIALMYDKYFDDLELYKCPSDKRTLLIDPKTFKPGQIPALNQSSYGWDPHKQQADGGSDVVYTAETGEVEGTKPADGTNSDHHGENEGQNVLYLDFHVSWTVKPTAGFADDNIYLPGVEADPKNPRKLSHVLK